MNERWMALCLYFCSPRLLLVVLLRLFMLFSRVLSTVVFLSSLFPLALKA